VSPHLDNSRSISLTALALSVSFLCATPPAGASQLVDRNATNVRIEVNSRGQALVTYRAGGRFRRVLARGALNARPSASRGRQVAFRLDYSGGWARTTVASGGRFRPPAIATRDQC